LWVKKLAGTYVVAFALSGEKLKKDLAVPSGFFMVKTSFGSEDNQAAVNKLWISCPRARPDELKQGLFRGEKVENFEL